MAKRSTSTRSHIATEFIDAVDKGEVLLRQENLNRGFDGLIREMLGDEHREAVQLNQALVAHLAYSYFYDVVRAKRFHGMKRINSAKKGAYTVKWIVRVKPISFDHEKLPANAELSEFLVSINEYYALRMGLAYAEVPASVLSERVIEAMIYQLTYRPIDEGLLALWFEFLIELAGKKAGLVNGKKKNPGSSRTTASGRRSSKSNQGRGSRK